MPFLLLIKILKLPERPSKPCGIQGTGKDSLRPAAAELLQSCPTLCNPIDGSPPGSPSLGFSRQEHWSGLPFPSPMCESEKWKQSRSVVSDSQQPQGLQPTRLLCPWDFPGSSTGVGCHCLLHIKAWGRIKDTVPLYLGRAMKVFITIKSYCWGRAADCCPTWPIPGMGQRLAALEKRHGDSQRTHLWGPGVQAHLRKELQVDCCKILSLYM